MAAFFIVLLLPFIYNYEEATAVFLFELFSVLYLAYMLFKYGNKFKLSNIGLVFAALCFTWYFTVGRSVAVSLNFDASFEVFFKITALLFLCVGTAFEFKFERKDSVWAWTYYSALAGIIHGIIALAEYIDAPKIPDTWLDPVSKDIFRTRCAGVFTDPNIFAAFLSVLFIFTIGILILSKKIREKAIAYFSLVLCGFGIFSTLSRGGWIALFLGLVIPLIGAFCAKLYYSHKDKTISYEDITGLKKVDFTSYSILGLVSLTLLVLFFAMPFKNRIFTKSTDMTFTQRTYINKGIIKNIRNFPLAGHGLQNFNLVYPKYRIVGGDYPLYCHNEFLQSIIETGFMSVFAMLLICFYSARTLFFSVVSPATNGDYGRIKSEDKICGLLFASIFIVLLVHNLSGFSSRMLPTSSFIAINMGFVFSFGLRIRNQAAGLRKIVFAIGVLSFFYILFCFDFYLFKNMLKSANIANYRGNWEQAEAILKEAIKSRPGNSFALASLGRIYEEAGKNAEAIDTYKQAAAITPSEASFYERIANLSSTTNSELADSMFKKTLELDPAAEYSRIEYVKFLISHDRIEEAKKITKKGLEYSPGYHNVYKGYAVLERILEAL